MTDPLRSDRPSSSADVPDRERDARIEALLLTGLDNYFAGQYELAINVWTRVLFLDRGHARARAYIERARAALSERQREGDELFHTGAAALRRGDRAAARQLLTSALEQRASSEEALALLHRLDRLEAGAAGVEPGDGGPRRSADDPAAAAAAARRESRVTWVAGGIVAGLLIAILLGGYLWTMSDPFELEARRPALPPVAEDPLPTPAPCELRLLRARTLDGAGRPHEALRLLEAGDPDERHRAAFDALRASIQRRLLAEGRRREAAIRQ